MRYIITERQYGFLMGINNPQKTLNEQKQWLGKLFGTSVDDVFKGFGDDAVKSLDDLFAKVFTKPGNIVTKGTSKFLKSASGTEIPMKTIQDAIEMVSKGKIQPSQVISYLPRNLADGTEFRSVVQQALESKGAQKIATQGTAQAARSLGQLETKNLLNRCFSSTACDSKPILDNFYRKLGGVAKLPKFDPSKVKVLEKSNVAGREIIDVTLEDGSNVLFYKSSGANVATTGKEAGEWFVIPGFAENGWFFKTKETIELTKGGNKYLTEMADFLKQNGPDKLGKGTTAANVKQATGADYRANVSQSQSRYGGGSN